MILCCGLNILLVAQHSCIEGNCGYCGWKPQSGRKKTVSKKFQVRLNCFLSHLFSFYFYLVFIIIIDMPPKAWRISWTWWSWPAMFNILRSLRKLQVEGKHSHSVGGSGGLYRFPECISWMIQCPQEQLLFCTLCESCTGFLSWGAAIGWRSSLVPLSLDMQCKDSIRSISSPSGPGRL